MNPIFENKSLSVDMQPPLPLPIRKEEIQAVMGFQPSEEDINRHSLLAQQLAGKKPLSANNEEVEGIQQGQSELNWLQGHTRNTPCNIQLQLSLQEEYEKHEQWAGKIGAIVGEMSAIGDIQLQQPQGGLSRTQTEIAGRQAEKVKEEAIREIEEKAEEKIEALVGEWHAILQRDKKLLLPLFNCRIKKAEWLYVDLTKKELYLPKPYSGKAEEGILEGHVHSFSDPITGEVTTELLLPQVELLGKLNGKKLGSHEFLRHLLLWQLASAAAVQHQPLLSSYYITQNQSLVDIVKSYLGGKKQALPLPREAPHFYQSEQECIEHSDKGFSPCWFSLSLKLAQQGKGKDYRAIKRQWALRRNLLAFAQDIAARIQQHSQQSHSPYKLSSLEAWKLQIMAREMAMLKDYWTDADKAELEWTLLDLQRYITPPEEPHAHKPSQIYIFPKLPPLLFRRGDKVDIFSISSERDRQAHAAGTASKTEIVCDELVNTFVTNLQIPPQVPFQASVDECLKKIRPLMAEPKTLVYGINDLCMRIENEGIEIRQAAELMIHAFPLVPAAAGAAFFSTLDEQEKTQLFEALIELGQLFISRRNGDDVEVFVATTLIQAALRAVLPDGQIAPEQTLFYLFSFMDVMSDPAMVVHNDITRRRVVEIIDDYCETVSVKDDVPATSAMARLSSYRQNRDAEKKDTVLFLNKCEMNSDKNEQASENLVELQVIQGLINKNAQLKEYLRRRWRCVEGSVQLQYMSQEVHRTCNSIYEEVRRWDEPPDLTYPNGSCLRSFRYVAPWVAACQDCYKEMKTAEGTIKSDVYDKYMSSFPSNEDIRECKKFCNDCCDRREKLDKEKEQLSRKRDSHLTVALQQERQRRIEQINNDIEDMRTTLRDNLVLKKCQSFCNYSPPPCYVSRHLN